MPEWIRFIATFMCVLWLIILIISVCYWVLVLGIIIAVQRKDDDDDEI